MTNATITIDPYIELETRFRRTFELPPFDANAPYYYTRDSALALKVVDLLKLTVAYDGMWTAQYDLSLMSYIADMLTAIFNVAIKAYIAEKPEAMLLYGYLSEPANVTVTHARHVERFVLVGFERYEASGGINDFIRGYNDLDVAIEALRACDIDRTYESYVYDQHTGRCYDIK